LRRCGASGLGKWVRSAPLVSAGAQIAPGGPILTSSRLQERDSFVGAGADAAVGGLLRRWRRIRDELATRLPAGGRPARVRDYPKRPALQRGPPHGAGPSPLAFGKFCRQRSRSSVPLKLGGRWIGPRTPGSEMVCYRGTARVRIWFASQAAFPVVEEVAPAGERMKIGLLPEHVRMT
jgi:hypothetical protein